ncbi:MAG: carboxypeptidase-like regulatory domain-containing protein [archaeon]
MGKLLSLLLASSLLVSTTIADVYTGKVVDKEGRPVVGATVLDPSHSGFVSTNEQGVFVLNTAQPIDSVTIRCIGKQLQNVPIASLDSIVLLDIPLFAQEVFIVAEQPHIPLSLSGSFNEQGQLRLENRVIDNKPTLDADVTIRGIDVLEYTPGGIGVHQQHPLAGRWTGIQPLSAQKTVRHGSIAYPAYGVDYCVFTALDQPERIAYSVKTGIPASSIRVAYPLVSGKRGSIAAETDYGQTTYQWIAGTMYSLPRNTVLPASENLLHYLFGESRRGKFELGFEQDKSRTHVYGSRDKYLDAVLDAKEGKTNLHATATTFFSNDTLSMSFSSLDSYLNYTTDGEESVGTSQVSFRRESTAKLKQQFGKFIWRHSKQTLLVIDGSVQEGNAVRKDLTAADANQTRDTMSITTLAAGGETAVSLGPGTLTLGGRIDQTLVHKKSRDIKPALEATWTRMTPTYILELRMLRHNVYSIGGSTFAGEDADLNKTAVFTTTTGASTAYSRRVYTGSLRVECAGARMDAVESKGTSLYGYSTWSLLQYDLTMKKWTIGSYALLGTTRLGEKGTIPSFIDKDRRFECGLSLDYHVKPWRVFTNFSFRDGFPYTDKRVGRVTIPGIGEVSFLENEMRNGKRLPPSFELGAGIGYTKPFSFGELGISASLKNVLPLLHITDTPIYKRTYGLSGTDKYQIDYKEDTLGIIEVSLQR